jgi:hypothetical protein
MRNPCAASPGGRADSSTVDAESTTTPESSMNHKITTLAITLALLLGPLAAEAAARSSWSHPA